MSSVPFWLQDLRFLVTSFSHLLPTFTTLCGLSLITAVIWILNVLVFESQVISLAFAFPFRSPCCHVILSSFPSIGAVCWFWITAPVLPAGLAWLFSSSDLVPFHLPVWVIWHLVILWLVPFTVTFPSFKDTGLFSSSTSTLMSSFNSPLCSLCDMVTHHVTSGCKRIGYFDFNLVRR